MKWFSDIKKWMKSLRNGIKPVNKFWLNIVKQSLFPIFDIFENQEEDLLYTDYFHPNDHGYKLMAKRIFSYLDNNKLAQFIE